MSESTVPRTEPHYRMALPLFVLVKNPDNAHEGWICKLDAEDNMTYKRIATGEWVDLRDEISYLHAGEDALHGPRI